MAAPTYATDLTDFEDFEAASAFSTEVTGYTATSKGEDQEADFPIQGSQHASAEQRTAAKGSLVSDYGSNLTWTSGDYMFMWGIFLAPNAVNTDANAGIEMFIGPSINQGYKWTVGGRDFGRYPYGGWQNFVVDPELTTGRTAIGSYTGSTYRWVGMLCDVTSAIAKGSPYGIDVIRYGRGELSIINGDGTSGYGTFVGMATANDASSAKWGLFQEQAGSYLWKGLMSIGTTTAVDFRDSNRAIFVDNTRRVQSDFNRIEINNASSNVEWTNISIGALGTVSPGEFEMVDNATVLFDGCTFLNMGTFIFLSNAEVTGSIFQGCKNIDSGGGNWVGTKVQLSSVAVDASAFTWNSATDPDGYMDNMEFSKGTNAHHAIEFGTNAPATININGITFTDFNASDGQNDSALYFPDTGSDVDWVVNASGCTGNIKYKKVRAGDTVTINLDQVSHTLTNLVNNSEVTYIKRGTAVDTGSDGSTTVNSRNFVTTNAWTVDAYKGHLLEITSGADAGRYYVSGNSATTLYLDTPMTATASSLTWELYDENDDTEVYHVESVTGNQTQYTYTWAADRTVDILIIHQDYEQIVIPKVVLGNTSQSLPQNQLLDSNYLNP